MFFSIFCGGGHGNHIYLENLKNATGVLLRRCHGCSSKVQCSHILIFMYNESQVKT